MKLGTQRLFQVLPGFVNFNGFYHFVGNGWATRGSGESKKQKQGDYRVLFLL